MTLEEQYPNAKAKFNKARSDCKKKAGLKGKWHFGDDFELFLKSMHEECGWIEEDFAANRETLWVSIKNETFGDGFRPGNIKVIRPGGEVVNYAALRATEATQTAIQERTEEPATAESSSVPDVTGDAMAEVKSFPGFEYVNGRPEPVGWSKEDWERYPEESWPEEVKAARAEGQEPNFDSEKVPF